MRYFIETSMIVSFLRGKNGAIQALTNLEGELTSSFVCLAELYEGIYRVKKKEKVEKAVMNFFSGLSQVFGIDGNIAKNFGQIRADLKTKGKNIEDLDILLAATCLTYNLTLVTYNPKHFKRIDNLKVLELKK